MPDNSQLQKTHFDNIGSFYINSRRNSKHLAYKKIMWDFILDKFKKYLDTDKKLLGIEAMCGNAETSMLFINNFPDIKMHAFDLSLNMINSIDKNIGEKIIISENDIFKLDIKNCYDFAVIIGGLHHIAENPDIGLKNIYNALKPNGIFLNLEPTQNNFLWKIIRNDIYRRNPLFEPATEKGFNLSDLNYLFKQAGFNVLYQFYPGLLGYVLYYNPDAFPKLNIGGDRTAKIFSRLDIMLGRTFIGRIFSFATWTIAQKTLV